MRRPASVDRVSNVILYRVTQNSQLRSRQCCAHLSIPLEKAPQSLVTISSKREYH